MGATSVCLIKFAGTSLVTLLLCTALIAQGTPVTPQSQTFHLKGTISAPNGAVIPGVKITFQSKRLNKTVFTNDVGLYEADLPLGNYSMTPEIFGFRIYRQLRLQITSPRDFVVNATAYPARMTCDIVVGNRSGDPATPEQRLESEKNLCGGEDIFPLPSDGGAPSQLFIQYPKRRPIDGGYVYSGDKLTIGDLLTPVFVEYNLFSLQADEVIYDLKNWTIKASGNVVVANKSGPTQRANSMTFQIENGQATPLH
jgi:hypothetical protein